MAQIHMDERVKMRVSVVGQFSPLFDPRSHGQSLLLLLTFELIKS